VRGVRLAFTLGDGWEKENLEEMRCG
jgi:hypothetical protein